MQDPQIVRKRLGEKIRYLREKRGITQDALGRMSRMSRAFIGEVERGNKELRMRSICKLAGTFGIPIAELFAGTDDLSRPPEGKAKP